MVFVEQPLVLPGSAKTVWLSLPDKVWHFTPPRLYEEVEGSSWVTAGEGGQAREGRQGQHQQEQGHRARGSVPWRALVDVRMDRGER